MSGIGFSWELNVGHLITVTTFTLGVIGAWFTMRSRVDEAHKEATSAKTKAEAADKALTEFKLEAARSFVQTSMLREVKDDLSREIRDIENIVRDALMSVLGKAPAPRRRSGSD